MSISKSTINIKFTIISKLILLTLICSQAVAQSGCLNVAWEADYHYYQLHGSNTENRINQVINEVEAIYKNSGVQLSFAVIENNVIKNSYDDPYGASSTNNYIGSVLNTLIGRGYVRGSVDVSLLFSGKKLSNHGAAYPDYMCSSSSCSVGIGVNKSQGYTLTIQQEAQIHAHEIAHLLTDGSHESGTNIMNASTPYVGATRFSTYRVNLLNQALNRKNCPACTTTSPVVNVSCDPVTNVSASNVTKNGCSLSWSAISGAQNYWLYYWGGTEWLKFADINGTFSNIVGMAANTTYYFAARANCGSKQSSITNWVVVNTPYYRLSNQDNANAELLAFEGNKSEMLLENTLSVYPNPAKEKAIIEFELATENHVDIIITDATGKEVRKLENGYKSHGKHFTNLKTADLSEGLYFCKIRTDEFVKIQKLMVVK